MEKINKLYFKDIEIMEKALGINVSEDEFLNHYVLPAYGARPIPNTEDYLIEIRLYFRDEIFVFCCVEPSCLTHTKPSKDKKETNDNPFSSDILYFKSWDIMKMYVRVTDESHFYHHHCKWLGKDSKYNGCCRIEVQSTTTDGGESIIDYPCMCDIDKLTDDKSVKKQPEKASADLSAYANLPGNSSAKTATVTWSKDNISVKESIRKMCLNDAVKCICSDRNNQYGEPEDNFRIIADYWTTYLKDKKEVTAQDVANMMILFKIGRLTVTNGTYDTYVDIAGYAGCGAEILGNNTDEK